MEQQTEQFKKKRRLLLVLPLLLLPFITLAYWRLAIGTRNSQQTANTVQGINTALPGAQLQHVKPENKLSLYEDQKRDSATIKAHSSGGGFNGLGINPTGSNSVPGNTAAINESKITQKLAQIDREINRPQPPVYAQNTTSQQSSTEADKLQRLMNAMNTKNAEDPEMKQLNGMLDKIMAIQNPGMAKAKQGRPSLKDSAFKAIPAVIEGNQKVLQGGVVKLRLMDSVMLKNITIPKGTLLFGSCNITNQRVLLEIKNIRLGNAIIPVDLSVFSLDGMPGIDAPEAELGEAAGNGTDDALQNMEFLPMDQSLSIQAAGAGINAAKSLIGKKVKKIKIKLHSGQRLLLRINKS